MPRKSRTLDGFELPVNLYTHWRKIPNRWRYKRPDGSWYTFEAPIEDAIAAAVQLNEQFAAGAVPIEQTKPKPGRLSLERHVEEFITDRERRDPSLRSKQSWANRRGYLRQLAREFDGIPVHRLDLLTIQSWWDSLTGNAQRSRKAEYQKLFNHLMARGLCKALDANPFSNSDDAPRVAMRAKPPKERMRLSVEQFWKIYARAGDMGFDFLQIAMGLSLVTTMRRGDLCELRFDRHLAGDVLRKAISKSHAQLSEAEFRANPSNLSWDLDKHLLLRQLVNRSRELSMKHARCPYLLSWRPQKRIRSEQREHTHQVLPDYITRAFNDARDSAGIFTDTTPPKARPTFHEIRALGSHLAERAGYSTREVQVLMAHTDEKITRHYQAGHATHWTDIDVVIPMDVIGGQF